MIVTTANSTIEPPIGDSDGAEENNFSNANGDAGVAPVREQQGRGNKQRHQGQPRREKRDVHGWVVLDKPIGMTSTQAVAVVKRPFPAQRPGHAGTLDPLGSRGPPSGLGASPKTRP